MGQLANHAPAAGALAPGSRTEHRRFRLHERPVGVVYGPGCLVGAPHRLPGRRERAEGLPVCRQDRHRGMPLREEAFDRSDARRTDFINQTFRRAFLQATDLPRPASRSAGFSTSAAISDLCMARSVRINLRMFPTQTCARKSARLRPVVARFRCRGRVLRIGAVGVLEGRHPSDVDGAFLLHAEHAVRRSAGTRVLPRRMDCGGSTFPHNAPAASKFAIDTGRPPPAPPPGPPRGRCRP